MAEIQAYSMMLRRNPDQEWNQESYPDSSVQAASARNSRWRSRQGKLSPIAMCVWSPLVWCPSEKSRKNIANHFSRLLHPALVLRFDQIFAIPDPSTIRGPVQAHIHPDQGHLSPGRLPEKRHYDRSFAPRGNMPDKDCVDLEFVAQAVEEILPRCG